MAKRGAEDQLTKDDVDSSRGRDSDGDEAEEIRRDASQEALAGRRIRGLPKRKAPLTATTSTTSTDSSAFGSSSVGTTPTAPSFSFGTPPSAGAAGNAANTSSFSFGALPATSATSAFPTATTQAKPTNLFNLGAVAPSSSSPASPFSVPKTASSETAAPATGAVKSPFGGFSFGTPAPAPSAATTAPASVPAPAPSVPKADVSQKPSPFSGFSFGAPKASAAASPSTSNPTSTSAAAASPAVPAQTAFAGGFTFKSTAPAPSASSSTPVSIPAEPTPTPAVALKTAEQGQADTDEKYLTSIRGLNTSVIRALEVVLKQDAFVDLGEALDRMRNEYKVYLREIKKEAGKPVDEDKVESQAGESRMDVDPSKAVDKTLAVQAVKVAPAASSTTVEPPKAGAFTLPAPSASSASPAIGGFKPAEPVTGFSFGGKTIGVGSKPATERTPAPSPFVFKPAEQAKPQATTAAAALVQGMLDEPATEQADQTPATPASKPPTFNFGSTTPTASPTAPSLNKRSSAIFAIKPEVRKSVAGDSTSMVIPPPASGSNPVPFIFKASNSGFNMGSSGSTSAAPASTSELAAPAASGSSAFGFSPAKNRQSSAGFSFGKTDSQASTSAAGETSAVSKPAFSFGAPPASGFAFGKPTDSTDGSNAKPASPFSFGAPAAASDAGAVSKPSPFSFGAPVAASGSSTSVSASAGPPAVDASDESGETPAATNNLTTGQGEEDEETLWENKAQIGTLTTNEDGKKVWTDWRVCKVKLKRENKKEGQAESQPMRRLLMRVDPSGQVYQNFSLRSIHAVMPLGPSGLTLSVAEAPQKLKQIGMRFGKKTDSFDPQPILQDFKAKVNAERRAMKLGEI